MEISSKKEEKLLERTEIIASMESDTPPSRDAAKQAIASSLKADPNLIVIRKITPSFGSKKVKILAHIYKTEEKLKEVEPKAILDKGKKKKEKPKPAAEAKPAEGKEEEKEEKAEKSKDEKKEEKKEQAKEKKKEKPKQEKEEKKEDKKESKKGKEKSKPEKEKPEAKEEKVNK